MLGIFLILCLSIHLVLELKEYYLLNDNCVEPVELDTDIKIYEVGSHACKLNALSIIVMLVGYLGCTFPFFFIEGIKTGAYIAGLVIICVFPFIWGWACYLCFKCTHGYIKISMEEIEWKRHKSFLLKVSDIQKIIYFGLDSYQIYPKEKRSKPYNINLRGFYKKQEIHSLMKQLRDYIAGSSGLDKSFLYKIRCLHWMFERWGCACVVFIKTIVYLVLFYACYCCIDYDFFRKDYTALYNALNADSTQADNAWSYYVQAARDYVELDSDLQKILDNESNPGKSELSLVQKEQIMKWVNNNRSSWENLKRAVSINYCNAIYEDISFFHHCDRDDFSHPNDSGYSQIKYLYSNINTARLTEAFEMDWFELFAMQLATSRHFVHGKSFIDQLMGYAMLHRAIELFAEQGSYELEDLQNAKTTLKEYFPNGVPPLSIDGEIYLSCGLFIDMIKHIDIPVQTPLNPSFLLFGSIGETEEYIQKRYHFILEDARKGIEVIPRYFSFMSFPFMRNVLVGIIEPSLARVYRIFQRTETTLSTVYVILDLENFYLTEGYYPADILQLYDAGFTSELPDDPDADGIIIYSNNGRRVILYAVGKNGIDDGGYRHPKESKEKKGDRIFWEREIQDVSEVKKTND